MGRGLAWDGIMVPADDRERLGDVMQQGNTTDGPSLAGLSDEEALQVIGHLTDLADDEARPKLADYALALADELEGRGLAADHSAVLDYFRANAWACRYHQRLASHEALWEFEQPELRQQVLLLRRAAYGDGFSLLPPLRRCQILTNLGNQLDTLGRFIEARACWNSALAIDPDFWMARANRARALMFYANSLYDAGHQCVFAYHAHRDMTQAVDLITRSPHLGDPRLKGTFMMSAAEIARHFDLAAIADKYRPDAGGLGRSEAERRYRRWCLANVLFLNPLNDVEQAQIAAADVLNLPTFTLPIDEPPVVLGMFNELKQSFASARWLLWEGVSRDSVHFSDRGVTLANTLDYPSYGLNVEKVRIAFRMAYSIFDKIAYFLDFYLGLGIKGNRIYFRTLWREKEQGPLRERISSSRNWPLRGLYWLSKDLFEEGMKDSTDPDARALAELRNHLEHKYVKVHEDLLSIRTDFDPFRDTLAYMVSRPHLERRTLRLLQLARSALIYLSLAMHHEERKRQDEDEERLSAPMSFGAWKDDWKR